MLRAEEPLIVLIDRLRAMSADDRAGVLARLTAAERRRVEVALGDGSETDHPAFAPDILARIAAPAADPSMTSATRAMLLQAAGAVATPKDITPDRPAGPSLFERLANTMRWR